MQAQSNPISPIDLTRGIWHNEGPAAFYKGTMSPLAGVSAIVSIQFATNEVMKRFMMDINTRAKQENIYKLSVPQFLISGAVAGGVSAIVACPIEHIRI